MEDDYNSCGESRQILLITVDSDVSQNRFLIPGKIALKVPALYKLSLEGYLDLYK